MVCAYRLLCCGCVCAGSLLCCGFDVGLVWAWCGFRVHSVRALFFRPGYRLGSIWVWCGFGVHMLSAIVWVWRGLAVGLMWVWCRFVISELWPKTGPSPNAQKPTINPEIENRGLDRKRGTRRRDNRSGDGVTGMNRILEQRLVSFLTSIALTGTDRDGGFFSHHHCCRPG